MEKIRELKKSHVICFSIGLILIVDLLRKIIVEMLNCLELADGNTNFDYMLAEFVFFCIALIMLQITGQRHILKCTKKSFFKSLWSGFVFFVLAIIGCTLFVLEEAKQGITYKSLSEIVAFIIFVILVGLAEEIIFRGIIADSIFEYFGNSVFGVVKSVVLGGIIFGFAHITNYFAGQSLEQTIIQMIATSMLGLLLTAIYLRHKNIFGVAILHTILDFMVLFMQGSFVEGYSLQYQDVDINFWESLKQSLISQSTFVIVALFVMRPSVIKKLVAVGLSEVNS